MIVKLKDVVNRVNNNIDRFNTDIMYYLGKGHGECGEIAITERGDLKQDLGMLGFKFHFAFKPGDSLFFSRSFALRKAGMAMYEGLCSDSTYILRSRDAEVLLPEYLPVVIQSDLFWEYCDTHHTGGVNFLINWSTLADYEFSLPPLLEQKALADKLWAAYRLKESYKKLLAATDEMVKAQFVEMFGNDSYRVNLETVVDIKDDCRKPLNDGVRSTMKTGLLYPYYGATGIVDYINDYITDEQLLCIAEDCGNYKEGEDSSYIINGKAWVNNHAHVVKPKDTINIEYLHQYLKMSNLMPFVSGTTRLKLTQKKLKEIPVILPSKEKQMEFVSFTEQAKQSKAELLKTIEAIDAVIKSLINN